MRAGTRLLKFWNWMDGATYVQVVVAMLICLASMKMYSYWAPFIEDSDDTLAEVLRLDLVRAGACKATSAPPQHGPYCP